MPSTGDLRARRLEDRLREARDRDFVGRAEELEVFRTALAGGPDAPVMLYVDGPGGIGKSALLRRFADEARGAGRVVVEVDGRSGLTPAEFERDASEALDHDDALLLMDRFEHCQGLMGWLRQRFLPRLPDGALIVVAGRRPLSPDWRGDPGWAPLLRQLRLSPMPHREAAALLDARQVPAALQESVLSYAKGNPLALCLAGDTARRDGRWDASYEVTTALLRAFVDDVPSPLHRRALEVCAHARTTTQDLLRAALPETGGGTETGGTETGGTDTGSTGTSATSTSTATTANGTGSGGADAEELFGWLRTLPFVESGRHGLFPHDLVRDALDAELRWRDRQGYEHQHRMIRAHLVERVLTVAETGLLAAVDEMKYLHRTGTVTPVFYTFGGEGGTREDSCRPADREALLDMARRTEGPRTAELVQHWIRHQPESFFVQRRSDNGEPVAFMAWLRLDASHEDLFAADPLVAAAWDHCRDTGPLRAGEEFAVARFVVDPASPRRPSPATDVMLQRSVGQYMRQRNVAWTYSVWSDPGFWRPLMDYCAHEPVAEAIELDGRSNGLFAHDWRAMPLAQWLDFVGTEDILGRRPALTPATSAAAFEVLARSEFAAAVQEALRSWRAPKALAASVLTRTRLVAGAGSAGAAGDRLRELLAEAADSLRGDARGEKAHRVLLATYVHGPAVTQEAAARRLDLSMSTYRRHLTRGVEQVTEYLWRQETDDAPPASLRA